MLADRLRASSNLLSFARRSHYLVHRLLPIYFEYPATFLWAVSGATLAARRGYDIAGIFTIALVTAAGGGVLRDAVFLQGAPPILVRTPIYLELVAGGTLLVMLVEQLIRLVKCSWRVAPTALAIARILSAS